MSRPALDEAQETGAVTTALTYAIDTGVKPVNETRGPGDMTRIRTGRYAPYPMAVRNGRTRRDEFRLDTHGFVFVDHPTAVTDFFDPSSIERVYYSEIERLVKAESGAARVMIFDHTLRSGDEATRNEKHIREPVKSVHNDYTEWSGPQRVRDLLAPGDAAAALERRFAIIQVWRAIADPIRRDPLAICDARTLEPGDLIASERRYPDRVGETYQIAHNPAHEWVYFPEMRRDEALVFKVYDSATDGRARFTAHSAFEDPTSPAGAGPRQSIEIRTLAFFDDE